MNGNDTKWNEMTEFGCMVVEVPGTILTVWAWNVELVINTHSPLCYMLFGQERSKGYGMSVRKT